ncbi:hypothetical protein [Salinigranum halophilum]|uniref:hypothetical protein n=1 Tax=Salinigranum halophilum TaxID=2565931 RepID=UPI0010A82D66|nr:hypothetical protein [Salinigranum halophilum]
MTGDASDGRDPPETSETSDTPDTYDDPVAQTLLDGSEFHRRRLAVGITRLSQRHKLFAFGAVAGSLALCLPIGATLPAAVRDGFLGGAPLAATPAILVVGLFGLGAELAAGLAVAAVSVRARQQTLTEREALHLVAVDNVATMAGLGVGTLAVLATLCGFAVGYGGVDLVQTFASPDNGVTGPYTAPALPLPSVGAVGVAALVVGGLLTLLGATVEADT